MPFVILPEMPQDKFELSDWLEVVSQDRPSGEGFASVMESGDSLTIKVKANKVRAALQTILGYSYSSPVQQGYQLLRPKVPVQHPFFPWLWADSCNIRYTTPIGNVFEPTPVPGQYYPRVLQTVSTAKYAPDYYAKYQEAFITVQFRNINWIVADDTDAWWTADPREFRRFFGSDGVEPFLDLITAEGASDEATFKYAEGYTGTPVVNNPLGTEYQGAVWTRRQQTRFRMIWKQVPLEYLVGRLGYNDEEYSNLIMPEPKRLVRFLGTINAEPFPGDSGQFAGTLLFDAIRMKIYQQPVLTSFNQNNGSEFGLWAADVGMDFIRFDPRRPPDANWLPNPGTTPLADRKRGHNLVPDRNSEKVYWYYATRGSSTTRGTYSGGGVYEELDYADMFYHVLDPNHPIPD